MKNHPKLYLYGIHAIEALLPDQAARIQQLWVQTGREQDTRVETILAKARQYTIPTKTLSRAQLDDLTGNAVHQGLAAEITPPPVYTEIDLDAWLDQWQAPLLLILDSVQDPHNLGACLRTANAAGAHAVVVPKDKSATLTPTVIKVASGAALITPLIQVTNLARTLRELKQRGVWIYGTCDSAPDLIYAADSRGAVAWVLGAEGTGMRRLTREQCDQLYQIPMQGSVSSLNVSVATGICLFETVRQRQCNSSAPG